MTEMLFLKDSYLKEFDATVKEVNGKFIVLDRTAFYPQGGGQPCDTGELAASDGTRYNVLFAKKISGNVSHEVDKDGLQAGDLIKGKIDWEKRHRFMRYHTAAHILSAVVHKETGAKISGNQITPEKARIDFNLEKFDRDKIERYANQTNEIISQNLPIDIEEMTREKAFKIPAIVKLKMLLPESIKQIRVVTISGIDQQACAGTHVSNTKEIGPIEVIKAENKGANNRRIYFILKRKS
ncbi:MAG: alanyl-tRNA editing protein AlaXM [Nanoarchaeota archaeon]|nr:alanyl-tRNA editing protein AlaXM [Nanoarchaeota archaeon]